MRAKSLRLSVSPGTADLSQLHALQSCVRLSQHLASPTIIHECQRSLQAIQIQVSVHYYLMYLSIYVEITIIYGSVLSL